MTCESLSLTELDASIFKLSSEIITIERDLELYSDRPKSREWLANAKAALKIKQLQLTDYKRRRELLLGNNTVESAFMRVARQQLKEDTFEGLWEEALAQCAGAMT